MNFELLVSLYSCILLLIIQKCHNSWASSKPYDISTLQQVQVIYRHGNRTPLFEGAFPLDPYKNASSWSNGWGQLTNVGKNSQFQLGKYLRHRYNGFLSMKYSSSEVCVRTSYMDRAITSALVNLAGLFPPTHSDDVWNKDIQWQPIPIYPLHQKIDNKISFVADCPKYKLRIQQILELPWIRELNRKHKDLYKYLTHHSGRQVKDFNDVAAIFDTLVVQKENGRKIPEWADSIFPEKMAPLAILPFELITYTKEMTKLRGGPLLNEMIHQMDTQTPSSTSACRAKMYMYSGHDTTVTTILNSLGLYDKAHIPIYGAMVMIELHRKSLVCPPFIKIFYRNESGDTEPHQLQVPGCADCKGICYLDKFKELLNDYVLSDRDFEIHCIISERDYDFSNEGSKYDLFEKDFVVDTLANGWSKFYEYYVMPWFN